LKTDFGGAAANVAVALGKLGLPSRLVASVGADFRGSAYEARLESLGVDLRDVLRHGEEGAKAFTFTDNRGRQGIYFFPGPRENLAAARVRKQDIVHGSAGDIAHYGPHFRSAEIVTLDPGQELFHRAFAEIEPLLHQADVLFVNEHERRVLERNGWPIRRLISKGTRIVVETRGARGQVLHRGAGKAAVPALPARVADPTGAGDAHRAGFLWAFAHGWTDVDSCRLGAVLAAFVVASPGAQAGLPSLSAAKGRFVRAFGAWPNPHRETEQAPRRRD
jgi:sugar/nucleoside kinase (ribokinase family)